MATVNHLYFDTPEYTASYDYDDVALKLLAVHCTNRMPVNLTVQVLHSADDSLLLTEDFPPGQTDISLRANQQAAVTLDSRGRVSNLYARTA